MFWSRTFLQCVEVRTRNISSKQTPGGESQKGAMLLQQENQKLSPNFEWVYQALSPAKETCKFSALCHDPVCGKWFCSLYAEDETWHRCALDASNVVARELEA
jgi:hypothetical protein